MAGYLYKNLIDRFPNLGRKTSSIPFYSPFTSPWIQTRSNGGLVDPSHEVMELMKSLEAIFQSLHGK